MGSSKNQWQGKFAYEINKAAQENNIDPFLIAAVIQAESNFNPGAKSKVGAMGLMQLMPATAKGLGVTNILDPGQNIEGGSKYLANLIRMFGTVEIALAAYNAGSGNVKKYHGIPPFKETENYVTKVMKYYNQFTNGKTVAASGNETKEAISNFSSINSKAMSIVKSPFILVGIGVLLLLKK